MPALVENEKDMLRGKDILLQILKRILQQVGDILLQELLVGSAGRGLIRRVDGFLDLARFNKVEHA